MKTWLVIILSVLTGTAAAQDLDRISELQDEMYKYFSTPEKDRFLDVTEQLKAECLKAGDEKGFYKAWANQAIYESHHQGRTRALEIAKEVRNYAMEHDSRFGEYTALHAMAAVQLEMQNYEEATNNFLQSIEVIHEFFPDQNAAAAYLELLKIANRRSDIDMGIKYAKLVLEEPNLQPQHEIRALNMLCQYAYVRNNREAFNQYYARWQDMVNRSTSAGKLGPLVEVDYRIVNGKYQEALALCEKVSIDTRYDRMATIYHLMGEDSKAYRMMVKNQSVKDSMARVNQSTLLSDYIVQLNNERMEKEQQQLEEESREWRFRFILSIISLVAVVAGMLFYQRQRAVKTLKRENEKLDKAQKETQKALDVKREFLNNISHELRTPLNPITGFSDVLATPGFELAPEERQVMSQHIKDSSKILTDIIDGMIELSYYESKTSLPLADEVAPRIVCLSAIDDSRHKCKPGVTMQFVSNLPDNVKIKTDVVSLQKVIYNLLDNAAKYTDKGTITVCCDEGKNGMIQISVEDTGIGIEAERQQHIFEMFAYTGDNVKTTGMGLSITQAILKLLGGQIWLDAAYTKGARFVVEVPQRP